MDNQTENCCLLTDPGKKALRDLLSHTYPRGWQNKNTVLAGKAGIDRGKTIANIVNSIDPQKPAVPVGLRSLEKFFQALFEDLSPDAKSEYLRDYPDLDLINIKNRARRDPIEPYWVCSPCLGNANPCAPVVNLLWTLDYKRQEKSFKKLLETSKQKGCRAIAFSIAAPIIKSDPYISLQEWLLCRLSKSVSSGWQQTATQILLEPPSSERGAANWGLIDICQEVQRVLEDNNIPIAGDRPQDVIFALAKYSQKHSVLIRVRNLDRTTSGRQIVIEKFWKPLLSQCCPPKCSTGNQRSRLIMFLLEPYNVRRNAGDRIYGLARLDMKYDDLSEWIQLPNVQNKLKKRYVNPNSLVNEIRDWECLHNECLNDKLLDILTQLCLLFNSNCVLEDVSEYWRI